MRRLACLLPLTILPAASCTPPSQPAGYQTVGQDPRRDTEAAGRLNSQAVELLRQGKSEQAEKRLKQALAADMMFAPAHNNLGTAYYRQQKYYLAAWEYQYASKIMPSSHEPLHNLGLVYEAAGKLDQAAETYQQALDLSPDSVDTLGNLARLLVRQGRNDPATRKLLTRLIELDLRPEWVQWAHHALSVMPKTPPATAPAAGPATGPAVGPATAPAAPGVSPPATR